jgi:protein RecA
MPIQKASNLGKVETFETGLFLDELLGGGAMPYGYIVEFFGEKDTGKSTAALQVIAAAQKNGDDCLLVDTEFKFTPHYAEQLGVDADALDVLREPVAETLLDELQEHIQSGKYRVIVMDSIGQLSSRIVYEKAAGEKHIGTQSSLIKAFLEKNTHHLLYRNILFIGISHERKTMDWGKIYSLGGNKWHEKKMVSVRFKDNGEMLKRGDTVVGRTVTAKVEKNHLWGTRGKEMKLNLMNNTGFAVGSNLAEIAEQKGVLTKEGQFYIFAGERVARGKVALIEALKDEGLRQRIKDALAT